MNPNFALCSALLILAFVTSSVFGSDDKYVGEYRFTDECDLRSGFDSECYNATLQHAEECFRCVHATVSEKCPATKNPPDCKQIRECVNKVTFNNCPSS